jgi:hypothetical protein
MNKCEKCNKELFLDDALKITSPIKVLLCYPCCRIMDNMILRAQLDAIREVEQWLSIKPE